MPKVPKMPKMPKMKDPNQLLEDQNKRAAQPSNERRMEMPKVPKISGGVAKW